MYSMQNKSSMSMSTLSGFEIMLMGKREMVTSLCLTSLCRDSCCSVSLPHGIVLWPAVCAESLLFFLVV